MVTSYDKSHLVPFGEYLPFPEFFGLFGISQFVPGTDGWAPGDGRRLMTPPGTPPFLALVCYEAVFPGDIGDPARAQFILNITNDAWFDGSIGPAQHAHHARVRAVETGLPLLRAANTGVTFAVDPLGRVTARLRRAGGRGARRRPGRAARRRDAVRRASGTGRSWRRWGWACCWRCGARGASVRRRA